MLWSIEKGEKDKQNTTQKANDGANSGTPEGLAMPAPLVKQVVLLLNKTLHWKLMMELTQVLQRG